MKTAKRPSLPKKLAAEPVRSRRYFTFPSDAFSVVWALAYTNAASFKKRWRTPTRIRRLLVVSILSVCAAFQSSAIADESDESPITVKELQAHASFLASDTLQGREAGTAGGQAVAAYLADQLRRLKFKPAGSETDYRQSFGAGYQNVIGVLGGSDPQVRDECIVLGAHFDHVGFGREDNSNGPFGLIHNGADDNASGVSCLLEIAEALRGGPALRRSVAVAFWDAEEKGLLGSEHWLSRHPNRQQIRFYTNLDMVGRLREDTVEVFGVRTLPGLRAVLAQSNVSDLHMKFDWSQRDDSDQHSFYLRRIPYVMLFSGLHYDYHRPSDDVEKLNFEGIEKVARVLAQHTTQLANHPHPLIFRESSRFELSKSIPGTSLPSRLGVTWSPTRMQGQTITLSKVETGLPADRAGLKPGDELLTINGQDVQQIGDFIAWIRQCPQQLEVDTIRAATGVQERLVLELDGQPLPSGATAASDSAEPGISILTSVTSGTPADLAGFRSGDRIHEVHEGSEAEARRWEVERDGRILTLPTK